VNIQFELIRRIQGNPDKCPPAVCFPLVSAAGISKLQYHGIPSIGAISDIVQAL